MNLPLLLISLLFFTSHLFSQPPAKILRSAEAALGGTKRLKSVSSSQRSGEITRLSDGTKGRIRMYAAGPNRYSTAFDLNGFETAEGFNSKSAWNRDSRNGLNTMTGAASLLYRTEALYRNTLWLNYKNQKSILVAAERTDIAGRPKNAVTIKTADGAAIKVFFDVVTGLPTREEFTAADQFRAYEYSDYRSVDRVLQPFRIIFNSGGETYEIKLDDIVLNAPVPAANFDFPNISLGPLPDIPTLLSEVNANEDRVEQLLETYAFTEKRTARELLKTGELRDKDSETFQVSFLKGYRINRLIEKNGSSLTESQQRDADRDAAKRVEEIEKLIAKREKTNGSSDENERPRMSVAEILRASNLVNPRRERFRGRDVIVFDFEPNPAFDYKNAKSMLKFFGKTVGVIWVDAADKQVARIEAVLADSFSIGGGVLAKLKKGASFTLEQERVNNEIWLPSAADINLSVRVFLVKGIDLNQTIRSYDYRKFRTEVNDAKVNESVKP